MNAKWEGWRRAASRVASAVVAPLTTPLQSADYSSLVFPLHGREMRGKVVDVRRHDGITRLQIATRPGFAAEFHPGQFVGLGVCLNGRWTWRCYSLTNAPTRTGTAVELGIKTVPGGVLTQHVAEELAPGDIIRLSAPGGDFYLAEPVAPRLAFVTAGVGITPVISMVRWLAERAKDKGFPNVIHIHSSRTGTLPEAFAEELAALSATHPGYRLEVWNSATQGRLTAEHLPELVPDFAERERFVCGPQELIDNVVDAFPGTRSERFFLGTGGGEHRGGTVYLAGKSESFECSSGSTILEAAEAAGIALKHGCRMGICHTCVCTVADGAVTDVRDGSVLTQGHRIRTCSTVASGDVTLADV